MARDKGTGTITFIESKKLYCGRLTVGYDDKGRQKRKPFYGKTKKEVQEKMTAAKADLNKGVYVEPSKMTVGDWMDIWLNEYKKRNVRASTHSNIHNNIKNHINPVIGKVKLKDLRTEMVQKFINDCCDKGLARDSVEHILSCVYGALEQALDNELIPKNVAARIILPKKEKKEMRVLTPEEQSRFIDTAKNKRHGELFILLLAKGLRIGEATALTWSDIDFEKGMLSVNKTITRGFDDTAPAGKRHPRTISDPKTKSSRRVIPLLPSVVQMLKDKKEYDEANPKNLLYTSMDGDIVSHLTIRSRFHRILEEANIERNGLHLHSLRHSFATRGLEQGIELKVMQEFLGHASIKMTADIYTHVLPDKKIDSMLKLAESINL